MAPQPAKMSGLGDAKVQDSSHGEQLLFDVRLTGGREDCTSFVRGLLDRAGVLLVPGAPFFADDPARGEQYVRIAFNRSAETLREAERRILAAA